MIHKGFAGADLVRLRRFLGLPRLPQHECTCGRCFAWVPAEEWCDGHRIDVLDELAALEERSRRLSGGDGDTMDYDENVLAMLQHGRAPVRACKVCGCMDDDCSGCIERTGAPCYWALPDICSACATIEQLLERSLELVRAGASMVEVSRLSLLASSRASSGMPEEVWEKVHAYAQVVGGADGQRRQAMQAVEAALAAVTHDACRTMMSFADVGGWRWLALAIGEPELELEPDILADRLIERLNILEASRMPDEPELSALVRAAAGLPRELVVALRDLADALDGVLVPEQVNHTHRALTNAVTAYVFQREAAHGIEFIVDAPPVVAKVLSHAGRMVQVEVIARWTSEQRRAALEWALGKRSEVPEFLSDATGDA